MPRIETVGEQTHHTDVAPNVDFTAEAVDDLTELDVLVLEERGHDDLRELDATGATETDLALATFDNADPVALKIALAYLLNAALDALPVDQTNIK